MRLIAVLALVIPTLCLAQDKPDAEIPKDMRESVVKIFSTFRQPDLRRPWTKQPPSEATGTGVTIDGKRILTNAHMVLYASRIHVQPNESSDKFDAEIVAVAPGIDLALLKLKDESYFDSHSPAPISDDLPKVGEKVKAYGYPKGGDSLSITEGIVSRIEYTEYSYDTLGLRIQVDAALNPGNSGGPAIGDHGKIVGLVFSGIPDADNIGYIIPVEEIRSFLDDIKDGKFDGQPQLRESMQTFENPALRERLGVGKDVAGMIITRPSTDLPDWPLKTWDIITAVGDKPVDNTGMVQVAPNLRLRFDYFTPKLGAAGKLPLSINRFGQSMKIDLPVSADDNRLLPHMGNSYPSYFIYGPLVFSPVYSEHQQRLNATLLSYRNSPILSRGFSRKAFEGEQLVTVCSPMFPHRVTKGYDVDYFPCVARVNGVSIKNLKHLIETLRDCKDDFVTFEWIDQHVENIVFKRSEIEAATDEILDDNGIRSRASADVADVWPMK